VKVLDVDRARKRVGLTMRLDATASRASGETHRPAASGASASPGSSGSHAVPSRPPVAPRPQAARPPASAPKTAFAAAFEKISNTKTQEETHEDTKGARRRET
jgi:transcriptional accessory protein Tex/SPT6